MARHDSTPTPRNPYRLLLDAEAHFVLLNNRVEKRAIRADWQNNPATPEEVRAHVDARGIVGIMPVSVGIHVVDVDRHADEPPDIDTRVKAAVDALGEPLSQYQTGGKGGVHLLYRAPEAGYGNGAWRYGENRCSRGYAIPWDLDAWLRAIAEASAADLVDPSKLPPKSGKAAGNTALQEGDIPLKPKASTPADLRTAAEGERNNTLNGGVYADGRAGRDRRAEWFTEATAAGLSEDEANATISSAAAAGEERRDADRESAIVDEHGLASAFTREHGADWAYRGDIGWLRWRDGAGWQLDPAGRGILEAVGEYGRDRLMIIRKDGPVPDPVRGGKAGTARGVVAFLSAQLSSDPAAWDADRMLLGLPGGDVLEIASRTIRSATRADRITLRLPAQPADEAAYLKHAVRTVLEHVIPNDEHREYFQRRLGAALADESGEDDFIALHGSTRGGKGSLVALLKATFGTYQKGVPPRALLAGQRDLHEGWKVSLRGARLIIADELGDANLDPEAVKGILGTSIVAAAKNRAEVTFELNAPVVATSNHPPSLANPDGGVDSRLKPIETGVQLPEGQQDPGIRAAMRTPEAAGVMLWWLLEGYQKFKAGGCPVPRSIREATAAVRAATPLAEFAATYPAGAERSVEIVYTEYREFMAKAGGRPYGKRKMGNMLCGECGWGRFDGTGRTRMLRVAQVAHLNPSRFDLSCAREEGVQGGDIPSREEQPGDAPLAPLTPLDPREPIGPEPAFDPSGAFEEAQMPKHDGGYVEMPGELADELAAQLAKMYPNDPGIQAWILEAPGSVVVSTTVLAKLDSPSAES